MDEHLMQRALALAAENVAAGGGPFGAIVVKDGRLVGTGVTAMHDPTAHAEVVAIRDACANLGTFQLDGCDLYTSCEPCPMCLGAIYWARPDRVFYAASRHDAASAGFDDALIYDEIGLEPSARRIPFVHAPVLGTLAPFEAWNRNDARTRY